MTDDPAPDDAVRAGIAGATDGTARAQLEAHLATAEWHLNRVIDIARTVQPLDLTDATASGVQQTVIDEASMRFAKAARRVQRHAERAQVTLDVLAKNAAALRWDYQK